MTSRRSTDYDLGYRQGRAAAERAMRTRDNADLIERAFVALLPSVAVALNDDKNDKAAIAEHIWRLAEFAVDHRPRGITSRKKS